MDFALSASDLLELKKLQRNVVGTPGYVKVTCVLMFAQGLSVQVISNSLGIDASSVVYYADGVHPTHNSRFTYAWIEKGCDLEQPSVSGRDRVNITGLLNPYQVTDIIALDQERINARSTKELSSCT